MSNIPADLRYASSHEWVRPDGDVVCTNGRSDHEKKLQCDIVVEEQADVGAQVGSGDDIAVAESVKAAYDVYGHIRGEGLAVNADLEDGPELVNSDPYGEGWLFKIRAEDPKEVEGLLDAEAYEGNIENE